MRADAALRRELRHVFAQQTIDAAAGQPRAAKIDEQRISLRARPASGVLRHSFRSSFLCPSLRSAFCVLRSSFGSDEFPVFQPVAKRPLRCLIEWHDALLAA